MTETLKTPTNKTLSLLTFANFKVGVLAALLAQPFEVIRTSSIINQHKINSITFAGMLKIIKLIKDSEGIKGFFRGGGLSIIKTTFGYTLFFSGLESMNSLSSKSKEQIPLFSYLPLQFIHFTNAVFSKTLTTLLISPINVLKTRFEVIGNYEYSSITQAMTKIYQTEGIYGFYRGIVATVIRDGPYSGIQYALYKSILDLSTWYNEKNANKKEHIVFAASVSSSIAIMMTYPFDNIRVRFQLNKGKTRSLAVVCKEVYANEGFSGFYKGYLPRLFKKICSSAVSWTLYEHVKRGGNSKE